MKNIVSKKFPKIEEIDQYHTSPKNVKRCWPEFYEFLLEKYNIPEKMSEKMYWYFHNIEKHPVCAVCGNPVKYINFKKGYAHHCSLKCSSNDPKTRAKYKASNLERYGVENPSQNAVIKNKIEDTLEERYGVRHALQNKDLLDKSRQTCKEHYGVESPSQNKEILEKQIQKHVEKYGGMGAASKETKKKIIETNRKKYGTDWGFENKDIQEKSKHTWVNNYGVENPFASVEIKEKITQTNLKRYGVENPSQNADIIKKIVQSTPTRIQKSEDTCLKKYGVKYYTQTDEYKQRIREKSEETSSKGYETRRKNNTFNTSAAEKKLISYFDDHGIEYKYQYKCERYPFHCDFYFPKTDTFLEIQGTWMHGFHPYNELNDKETLDVWIQKSKKSKSYETAIKTWTERDVAKRNWAKENNLNLVEIFSCKFNDILRELTLLNIL